MDGKVIRISGLGKTWIFDLDGTIVKHNGYLLDGKDTLLSGVKEFFRQISEKDRVIVITSRAEKYKEMTENFLEKEGIPYYLVLYDMPYGERILVNDKKESGLATALAVNTERNEFMKEIFVIDDNL